MRNVREFRGVIGVVVRKDGSEFIETCEFNSQRCKGPELTDVFKATARGLIDEHGDADVVTSFYFATTNADIEFTDAAVYRWLADRNAFKLKTMREIIATDNERISKYVEETDLTATQVGGSHYCIYTVQPRDLYKALGLDWDVANTIKYLIRFRNKNGHQDLCKAFDYASRLLKDGLDKFKTKRKLKADVALYDTFYKQFDPDVQIILGLIGELIFAKIADEAEFKARLLDILFGINHLSRNNYDKECF